MRCEVTRERLSAWTAGDLEPPQAAELERHVAGCATCRERLAGLRALDQTLAELANQPAPAAAVERARASLAGQLGAGAPPEIMTLDEVAAYLRLEPEQLETLLPELPLFALAGTLRMRRSRLLAWIESRERRFTHDRIRHELADLLAGRRGGVA